MFSNEERALVGRCYKQQGQNAAVKLGLSLVGPKLADFVERVEAQSPERALRLYCWRGGMRSASMAWLLETAGYQVSRLEGGYKAFRSMVRAQLANREFLVLGGYTGSAKTRILQQMAQRGAQVVDLEQLANHKGSAFGNLLDQPQPSSEHFSNLVWQQLQPLNKNQPIWLEDESRHIGTVWLDLDFAQRIESSPLIALQRSRQERAAFLASDYGRIPPETLAAGFEKIRRKLGGAATQQAAEQVRRGDLTGAAELALHYYDKTYEYGMKKRPNRLVTRLNVVGWNNAQIADYLIAKQSQWATTQ